MLHNVNVYDYWRVQAPNLANSNQLKNPRGFSEVGENKQVLIAIVSHSFYSNVMSLFILL